MTIGTWAQQGSTLGLAWLLSAAAMASTTTYSGFLGDSGNAALVASDLNAARFADDFDVANNVALYSFHLATAGGVSVSSLGFAAGGVDPYFTLFAGNGLGSGATFVGSNYDIANSTGGDFTLSFALGAGDYTLALGVFTNMSFAENAGTGNLDDGFTGLGGPMYLYTSYYKVAVTTDNVNPPGLPEPASTSMVGLAALALWATRRAARGRRART